MAKAAKPTPAARAPRRPAIQATAEHVKAQAMTTGPTVTVACKLPNGFNLGPIHGPNKPDVILRGSNHAFAVGGFGLTHNIGADEFGKWKEDHAFLPAIKNGLIFEHGKGSHASAMAADMADVESGLEPLNGDDPGSDPRVQDAIAPTDEQRKETEKSKDAQEERLEELRATTDEDEH